MPRYSVWSIKSALVYFLLGITIGALILSNKAIPFFPMVWSLLPLHIEYLFIGWTILLIFGVAFWITPRFRGSDYGNVLLAWAAYVLLNLGLLLLTFGNLLRIYLFTPIGHFFEFIAVVFYAIFVWNRIRPT